MFAGTATRTLWKEAWKQVVLILLMAKHLIRSDQKLHSKPTTTTLLGVKRIKESKVYTCGGSPFQEALPTGSFSM